MASQLTVLCLLCAVAVCVVVPASAVTAPATAGGQPGGEDPDTSNRCKWLDKEGTSKITRFSVLPGGGWDNLRNRDMGQVAELSFRDCTLSDDGTYVTPSHVILYPKRESQVSMMSHVMEHYENYTSTTSVSINLGGNGIFHGVGIDGKISEEFQSVKKTALSSRTQVGRTQQRYNMYAAQLQPDFKLGKSFANRLMDIGNALINNQTSMARYFADLVVRDFGTHIVTSVDAGAILEKIDYFNRNSLTTSTFTSNKISQCISVSFANVFGVKSDSSITVTNEEVKQYINSVQQTTVNSHGGPPIGAKINLDEWEARLRENLVPIDKVGEAIFSVISQRSLPQIPFPYLKGVIDSVKNAVLRYYKANEVKGCLDPNSANFDPIANVEGACQPPMTNFSFAGVYQTCQETRPDLSLGLCGRPLQSPVQTNPITGTYSCPAGYEPVTLLTANAGRGTRCFECRHSCWLFWKCSCGVYCHDSVATVTSYWCSATKDAKLPSDSGMIYGGAYSPRFNNPATDAKSCGSNFRPFPVARDISLCLSSDIHDAAASRIPLGGFFTCQAGNPLAEPGRRIVAASGAARRFFLSTPGTAPKRCPEGFSQSTIDIVDGCELMQCVRATGSDLRRTVAKRPPYEDADFRFVGPPVSIVAADGRVWGLNGTTGPAWNYLGFRGESWGRALSPSSDVDGSGNGGGGNSSSSGAPIGALIALLATIGLVILAAIGYALRGRLGRRRRGAYRQLDENASRTLIFGDGGRGSYGSVAAEEVDEAEVVVETPRRQ